MWTTISATTIGVTYSTPDSVQLSPDRIAAKFVSMKIPAVRLLDSNPAMIRAFAYTNVSLLLSVPNTLVPLLASNRSLAMHWVHVHVLPFHRSTRISTISVGNDVISNSPPPFLLRAMQNVHLSLADLRIYGISVSTTLYFFEMIPLSAQSQHQKREVIIVKEILGFLEKTNSSFLISLCPYSVFRSKCSIPVGYGQLEKLPLNFRDDLDLTTGAKLLDMMVGVVISSMAVTGHENLPVIVAETGWPRSGSDASEVDARWMYSEMLLKALVAHGPLRIESVSEVYMYKLVENDANLGIRNWGLDHKNITDKYSYKFSAGGREYPLLWCYLEDVLVFCCFVFVEMFLELVIVICNSIRQKMELRRRAEQVWLRLEELHRARDAILRECEENLEAIVPFGQSEVHLEWVRNMRNQRLERVTIGNELQMLINRMKIVRREEELEILVGIAEDVRQYRHGVQVEILLRVARLFPTVPFLAAPQ